MYEYMYVKNYLCMHESAAKTTIKILHKASDIYIYFRTQIFRELLY